MTRTMRPSADRAPGGHTAGEVSASSLQPGTPQTFEDLYRRYKPMLERHASREGSRDPDGASDLALFDGFRAMSSLDNQSEQAFRSYVFKAATGHVIDELRGKAVPLPVEVDTDTAAPAESFESDLIDAWELRALVNDLPIDQRNVIGLRFFRGLSGEETATLLNKTPNAVYQLQHRAVNSLRRALLATAIAALVLVAVLAATQRGGQRVIDNSPADNSFPPEQVEDVLEQRDLDRSPPTTASIGIPMPVPGPVEAGTSIVGPVPDSAATGDDSTLTDENGGVSIAAGEPTVTPNGSDVIGSERSDAEPGVTATTIATGLEPSAISNPDGPPAIPLQTTSPAACAWVEARGAFGIWKPEAEWDRTPYQYADLYHFYDADLNWLGTVKGSGGYTESGDIAEPSANTIQGLYWLSRAAAGHAEDDAFARTAFATAQNYGQTESAMTACSSLAASPPAG